MRDNQRKRVYKSEHVLPKDSFQNIDEARNYLYWLFRQDWFKRVYPKKRMPQVVETWGTYHSMNVLKGEMRLLPRPYRWIVLHELAHWLTPMQAHGPKFVGAFLWLVKNAMGQGEYEKLKGSFREKRVVVNEIVEPAEYSWDGKTLTKDGVEVPLETVLDPSFTDVDLARQIVQVLVNRKSEQYKE